MKKIFAIAILSINFCMGQAPVLQYATVEELETSTSKQKFAQVTDSLRGGFFTRVPKGDLFVDTGVIFKSGDPDWVWARNYDQKGAVNLRWWGAIGDGFPTYQTDSAALTKVVAFLNKHGGKLYVPASRLWYGYNGRGLLLRKDIEIFGDGAGSEIRNVNPNSVIGYAGAIFFTGTFANRNSNNFFKPGVLRYKIIDAPFGQSYVLMATPSDADNFETGDLVFIGSNRFNKKDDPDKTRYAVGEGNKIYRISDDTLFLKYAISSPIGYTTVDVDTNYAEIVDVNAGVTNSPVFGVSDFMGENISIHDMTLSQADYDMIDNTPYTVAPYNVIGLGCVFEGRFYNLTLTSYGTFGGNYYSRCDIHNLNIVGARKFTDLGANTNNTLMHDVNFHYKKTIPDATERAFFYLNDGLMNVSIYNITARGSWTGTNIFQFSGSVHNVSLTNVDIFLPQYVEPDHNIISIDDEDKDLEAVIRQVTLKNVVVTVDTVQRFFFGRGLASVTGRRDIKLIDSRFMANYTIPTSAAVSVENLGNIEMNNVTFIDTADQIDSFYVKRVDTSRFIGVTFENARFSHQSNALNEIFINNCIFDSSDVPAYITITPSRAPTTFIDGRTYYSAGHVYTIINGAAVQLDNASFTETDPVMVTRANTYTAGMKQTFTADATNAGLSLAGVTANPSSLSAGNIWFRSDENKLHYYDGTTDRKLVAEALSQTLTNKILTGNTAANFVNTGTIALPTVTGTLVQFAEATTASSGTPAPTGDARVNWLDITAQAAGATFAAPSGTPANHNELYIRVKDDGTARNLNWNAIYRASTDLPLPAITIVGKTLYCKFIYNGASSTWDLVSALGNF